MLCKSAWERYGGGPPLEGVGSDKVRPRGRHPPFVNQKIVYFGH